MTKAGLRELRQHASDLVRRAERGETVTVTVTVSGREVAQLGPLQIRRQTRANRRIQDVLLTDTVLARAFPVERSGNMLR